MASANEPLRGMHLESAEDVAIVRGAAEDLGAPAAVPEVVAAQSAKYTAEGVRQYLPDADPDFDVVCAVRAQSAMMWRLAGIACLRSSAGRWRLSRRARHGLKPPCGRGLWRPCGQPG